MLLRGRLFIGQHGVGFVHELVRILRHRLSVLKTKKKRKKRDTHRERETYVYIDQRQDRHQRTDNARTSQEHNNNHKETRAHKHRRASTIHFGTALPSRGTNYLKLDSVDDHVASRLFRTGCRSGLSGGVPVVMYSCLWVRIHQPCSWICYQAGAPGWGGG